MPEILVTGLTVKAELAVSSPEEAKAISSTHFAVLHLPTRDGQAE